ncbi:MAG: IclR family transcriptional regulator [Candidatus Rokubacteria bacterium]|nr:IclR family transcriptional regulator [Candidatus Rokubacteria bacterium]
MANRHKTVKSLERGLDILETLSTAGRALGITDLSRRLGLAKGSVARLVATFVQRNYLSRNRETAKYRIGMRIWELGQGAVAALDVRNVAHPVMEQLHAATQETVHLTVLTEEGSMVFLDKLDSTKAIRPNVQLGARLPPYCVANGKAVLAFRPEAEVETVLRGKLRRFTSTTVTRKRDLLAVLDSVRRLGYAVNNGEFRADVSGVAAPIRDHTGLAVAALGISVPTIRMTPEHTDELARLAVKAAQEISLALGQRCESPGTMESAKPRVAGRTAGRGQGGPAVARSVGG